MVAQRELLRRSLDSNGYERRLTAESVLSWANRVHHKLHPGFRRTLETIVQRDAKPDMPALTVVAQSDSEPLALVDKPALDAEVQSKSKRVDPRERLGMAKLLVAIAIE